MPGWKSFAGCWRSCAWRFLHKSCARPCRFPSSVCKKRGRPCNASAEHAVQPRKFMGHRYNPAMTVAISSPSFVHLRVHSEFSVVDGIARTPDLVKKAAEYGQPAMALTDLSNLFGFIKFYKAARKAGVKPIAGSDRSEEHTSELQSLMRISYAVFCLKKKKQ